MTRTARGVLGAAFALTAACGSSASTSTPTPGSATATGAATAGATGAGTGAAVDGTATTVAATARAADSGVASPRATAADCEKLHEASRAFGRAMLEGMERDPARRETLFAEMDKKLRENKKDYLTKCAKLSAAGVSCAAVALERKDTMALAACPIDISVLDRE